MIDALTQRHFLPMMTPVALLRCISRVDLDELSASFFRFAGQVRKKGRPRRITNALCQTMIVQHPIDVQIFHTDHAEAVYNLAALLMGEVVAFERRPRKVNTDCHVLQDLGMNAIQRGTLFFQHRIGIDLPIATQALALLRVSCFAVLKQVVVEPSALFKGAFKTFELFLSWIYPILEVFMHDCMVI